MDTLKHLLEVELADLLSEGTRVGDVVEELSASDHLLDDVGNVLGTTASLVEGSILLKVVIAHHIVVVKLRGRVNFLTEKLESTLVEVGVIEIEDLEGELLARLVLAYLDFGREAGAESAAESESVECGGHFDGSLFFTAVVFNYRQVERQESYLNAGWANINSISRSNTST